MVLATITQCAILCSVTPSPNAADAWRDFSKQIEGMELGVNFPQGTQGPWNAACQAQYEALAPLIAQVREISGIQHCDWELDYSEGPMMLMPQFQTTRMGMYLTLFSIQGDIENGNVESAMDGLHSIVEISGHHNSGDTIISSLVSASIFASAGDELAVDLVGQVQDPAQLDELLQTVTSLSVNDPFGIRKSVGAEGDMMFEWLDSTSFDEAIFGDSGVSEFSQSDLDSYGEAMVSMAKIFQIENRQEALVALDAWDLKIDRGESGVLAKLLAPAGLPMLETAFTSEERVAAFKQLLQDKIEMLRSPNAAMYFLKAVDSYNAIDVEEREKMFAVGDFSVLEEPLSLFAKACSMPVTQITLSNLPATPRWVAPLYSLALNCLEKGSPEDTNTVIAFIRHMSMQKRFAASIVAGKLFEMLPWQSMGYQDFAHIPSADAFSLHSSFQSDKERLKETFEVDNTWDPSKANVLAMTCTIAKEGGIADENLDAWRTLIDAIGIPDDDAVIVAILEEWMPESLPLIALDQEPTFNAMLKVMQTRLATHLKSKRVNSRPTGR